MESSCIYCGCGCRLNFEVRDNKIVKVVGVKTDDVSDGTPCIKGLTINEVFDKNRITYPSINGKKVTLQKALDYVYNKTKNLSGHDVFFNTSGKITNENNLVMQKFARVCYQTSNVDSCCGRLCHIATVMGMMNVLGTSNVTKMNYINEVDTLFIIGSEPHKNYPVFYNKMMKKNDLKVLKVHSFAKGCDTKECIINILPGSETCLLNGLINELIKKGVKSKINGFKILEKKVKNYNSDFVCKTCNINKNDYNKLVKNIYNSKNLGVFHGMALTQHVNSLENIHSLLNLVLLKDAKVLTLRGEINVQGAGDLGGSPGILPTGFLNTKKELEKVWGKIDVSKGLNILEALLLNPVKALFLVEFDPLKSMPATDKVKNGLKNSFIVYFGSYNNTTSKRADVVIPIASLIESEGTITNGEKRLRKVNKVVSGELELWEVLKQFSKKFNKSKNFNYKNSKEIFNEIKFLVQSYKEVNVNNLWKGFDEWADKSIKFKRFMPEQFEGLDDNTSKKYPFLLTTYRSKYSFLSNEITKYSKTLSKQREPAGFYFNPKNFKKLKLVSGVKVKVTSSEASLVGKAYSSSFIPENIVGAYMHYCELPVNKLYPVKFDEESYTPNYKSVAVNVEKV